MREIKFRAFIDGEMIYDLAYEEYAPINYLLKGTDNLMQFTGLLDKQGVEIYEGDILSFEEFEDEVIFFKYGAFGYGNRHFVSLYQTNLSICEVIGNIYENSELLK